MDLLADLKPLNSGTKSSDDAGCWKSVAFNAGVDDVGVTGGGEAMLLA